MLQNKSTAKKKTLKASKDSDKAKIDSKLKKELIDLVKKNFEFFSTLKKASEEVGYKVDDLIKRFEVESSTIVGETFNQIKNILLFPIPRGIDLSDKRVGW